LEKERDESMNAIARMIGNRWTVCALLFFATTINYIDRQILSLLKPILDEQLHWTNAEFGLVNSAFQGAYGISLLGFGWFIDRFGTKIGYTVSIVAWSVAAMGHALVGSVGGFIWARVALGLGEGGNFPAAIKTVALWFPKKERALATSIFNSGTNVGAIVAPAIVPWMAFTWGWQSAFIAAGLAGFVWLFFWIPWFQLPEKMKGLTSQELSLIRSDEAAGGLESSEKLPWGKLLGYRQTWAFIIPKLLTDPVWWFFLIWLPDFFKQTRGLDIKKSWVLLVIIYSIVTVLSIAGGWVTGHLAKMGWSMNRARKGGMLLFALCVVPILAVTGASDWGAVLLIGLAGAAHQAFSANLFTTVSDSFPKQAVASVIGIGGMAGAIGGMLFPIVTGILLDSYKASGNVAAGYGILFAFCAGAYLFSLLILQLLNPKLEPVHLTTA
jgi:ACS family hexuronate transporter-like MFS transporter